MLCIFTIDMNRYWMNIFMFLAPMHMFTISLCFSRLSTHLSHCLQCTVRGHLITSHVLQNDGCWYLSTYYLCIAHVYTFLAIWVSQWWYSISSWLTINAISSNSPYTLLSYPLTFDFTNPAHVLIDKSHIPDVYEIMHR